jgi:ornithine cyclodeaminase/alanine dehydrogenase
MCRVRPIADVAVVSRTLEAADRFVAVHAAGHPAVSMRAVASHEEAVKDADIICAVSSSREPVVRRGWLRPGCHINGVGSHGADVREVDGETMRDARVVVDSRESALRECGDCLLAIAEGLIDSAHVSDEIGEVLLGTKPGRASAAQITVYQSCGLAIQDVATARLAYEGARATGRGVEVDLA